MTLEMGHRQEIDTDLPVTMTTSWTSLEQHEHSGAKPKNRKYQYSKQEQDGIRSIGSCCLYVGITQAEAQMALPACLPVRSAAGQAGTTVASPSSLEKRSTLAGGHRLSGDLPVLVTTISVTAKAARRASPGLAIATLSSPVGEDEEQEGAELLNPPAALCHKYTLALVEKGTFLLRSKALAAVQARGFPQQQDLTECVQQKTALSVPAQKTFFQACA
ncbi:hypothetical protein HGM15179_013287 [Zosterops borbonicus]|uniref:Uncharacterized protein n=1 Tax=Zosterops borbonicus TaxID=364589 RepID=A0A8K1LHG6_9PASS|nr:hypothetical protein HGM15179_013287 [Zosterops borbonicus]